MAVSFDPSIADASTERKKLAKGVVKAVVKTAKMDESEKKAGEYNPKYHMIVADLRVLEDPNDVDSATRHGGTVYQCLPFERDHWKADVKNGTLPMEAPTKEEVSYQKLLKNLGGFARDTRKFLTAMLGSNEIPDEPTKNNGRWFYQDEEINGADVKSYQAAARKVAGAKAAEFVNSGDCSELEGCTCYCQVSYEIDKRTGEESDWPTLTVLGSEPPVDKNGMKLEILSGSAILE
jgi:hypothetical protein